ncbi:class I SAM-dependent methyltransferase [Orbaceae bacterium ESL0721]|nr:class I SAM-dependent methyltransferase [Orbaceae bacterium ESL0721]
MLKSVAKVYQLGSCALMDYRDLDEKCNRIVSISMFEHVGQKNYATYFTKLNSLLADDGLFLLHTIWY